MKSPPPPPHLEVEVGGGGVPCQGFTWAPTHGPRRLPCGTRLGGRTWVSGPKACRTVASGGARGREMPPCLCVCALVCLKRGGGGLWHTCLIHCWLALACVAQGSLCLVLQAPAGRQGGWRA